MAIIWAEWTSKDGIRVKLPFRSEREVASFEACRGIVAERLEADTGRRWRDRKIREMGNLIHELREERDWWKKRAMGAVYRTAEQAAAKRALLKGHGGRRGVTAEDAWRQPR